MFGGGEELGGGRLGGGERERGASGGCEVGNVLQKRRRMERGRRRGSLVAIHGCLALVGNKGKDKSTILFKLCFEFRISNLMTICFRT